MKLVSPTSAQSTIDCGQTERRIAPERVLVSVRSAAEYQLVREMCPRVWVDLKDPSVGSIGRPSASSLAELVDALDRRPAADDRISLALGDLEDYSPDATAAWPADHLAMVKIGVRQRDRIARDPAVSASFHRIFAPQRSTIRRALVYYSDLRDDGSEAAAGGGAGWRVESFGRFCSYAASSGFTGVLIDTCHKRGNSTFDYLADDELANLIKERSAGLPVMLAGGLTLDMLDSAIATGAAIVGFRSAICRNAERRGEIDPAKLRWLLQRTGGTIH